MYIQFKQILIFFTLIIHSFLFSEECTDTNPTQYGACQNPLGFVWTGNSCVLAYGCDVGDDISLFFETYEECDINCSDNVSLGDLNDDANINVVDIVILVNLILQSDAFSSAADINFDDLINVVDIVSLINIILTTSDTRDTWQIINEDILTPKCAICHYEGSFYTEISNLNFE